MKYGINVKFFAKQLSLRSAAELVAQAGFTMLDYIPDLLNENWETEMKEAKAIFDDLGLCVHQTHAPFNRYGKYGKMHDTCLERCAEATEFLGAKFMVTHADEFDFDNCTFSPEAALDYNYKLFSPYVDRAEKNGYKLAFETVFEDWNRRRFTSQADELMDMITSFHSDSAVCCWDFGHGNVTFQQDAPNQIRRFGKLIQCTHLHDNAGMDSHQMPMTGDINWKETIEAFKSIPYEGILSVEYAHGSMPTCLTKEFIELTFKTAKYIWES